MPLTPPIFTQKMKIANVEFKLPFKLFFLKPFKTLDISISFAKFVMQNF